MNEIIKIATTPALKTPVMLRRLSAAPLWSAAIVSLASVLVFSGWMFEADSLKRIIPGYTVMNPVTPVAFILSSIALWLLQSADTRRIRFAGALAVIVSLIGLIKLCAIVGLFDIGIDRILFTDRLFDNVTGQPNRINPNTAFNFLLFGAALLLINFKTKRYNFFPSEYLTIAVLLTSFLAIVDYFYDAQSFKTIIALDPMTIYAALLFFVLAVGLLLSKPEQKIIKELLSHETGGEMARRLFPLVIIIPAFLGWLG